MERDVYARMAELEAQHWWFVARRAVLAEVLMRRLGLAGRGEEPLVFSTEIAATFIDAGDDEAIAAADIDEPTALGDLDFSTAAANVVARRRFKKVLPGMINIRTDGKEIYATRRVKAGYQWESYGPIEPID